MMPTRLQSRLSAPLLRWAMSADPTEKRHVQVRMVNHMSLGALLAALEALGAHIRHTHEATIDADVNSEALIALSHHQGVAAVVEGRPGR